jgi:PAS domain S-box-containing protein
MTYSSKAKWLGRPAVSFVLRYGLAVVSVGFAQVLAHTFLYFHLPQPLTAFALSAIAITFRYGGTDPGILAALLAALIRSYIFEPEVSAPSRLLYDLVFLVFTMVMIHFTRERKELEEKVAARTAELARVNEALKLELAEGKEAEDRVRLIIDTIPMMAWSIQPQGAVDFVNQRWVEFTGVSLAEEIEEPTRVVHPEDLPRVIEKWQADMAAGEPSEDEMRLRRADGEYRWFLVRTAPLRNGQGKIVKWYGVSIDIEDRNRMEQALRASERDQRRTAEQLGKERARLVEAQEVAKIGSWEAELQSLNVIWSEQTHRIFETDPSRFHPTRPKFREYIHPEDRAKVDAAFAASLDQASACTVEYRIVMPDGRVKFLEERWKAFLDGKGKPVRVAGTCFDVTERVWAEEELRKLSGRLLQLQDEERRRIARDLHDSMGQDLVALATMLGQLHGAIPSGERKARRILSECKALADRCIREIRTLSYVLHPPVLDEAGLEGAIRDYVTGFTRRSGIRVELELPPGLGRMARDVELTLFRVVQEALANIQRHSGSQQAKIRIDRNSHLMLEISDLGHGASAREQRGKGELRFEVGVGIPSMQERVKLIGGRFEFESTSQGTTVRVTISLERNEREKAAHSGG